jgi:hypothetical protein
MCGGDAITSDIIRGDDVIIITEVQAYGIMVEYDTPSSQL